MGKRFFKETIRDVDLRNQTVLVRVDYNVPLDGAGKISDDLRIRASLPTLLYLLERDCRVVLISHLGRPAGRDSKLSLELVAEHLAKLLDRPVRFVDDCVGDKVRQMVRHLSPASVLLLENLRFYAEEEADDEHFARSIVKAIKPDLFVQDGFGVVHRAHASTHSITLQVPSVAGFLIEKEYSLITKAMAQPKQPLVAILGGAKISDKIQLIERLIDKADQILIGGAMANTFLAYKGFSIGQSLSEPDQREVLDRIYDVAAKKVGGDNVDELLVLPVDVAVAASADDTIRREVKVSGIGEDDRAFDIGSRTIEQFTGVVSQAKTIIWNGPLGLTEKETFSIGSARVAMAIAQNSQATSIVGGGDTADFVLEWDGHDGASFTHVSTGGGASMELMSGKSLPGIDSLLDAYGVGVVH